MPFVNHGLSQEITVTPGELCTRRIGVVIAIGFDSQFKQYERGHITQ
jgi:hypothetical protein